MRHRTGRGFGRLSGNGQRCRSRRSWRRDDNRWGRLCRWGRRPDWLRGRRACWRCGRRRHSCWWRRDYHWRRGLRRRLHDWLRFRRCFRLGFGSRRPYSPANDEALGRHRSRRRLRLPGVDDPLDRGVGLIVLERAGMALDVVPEGQQLGDDLLVVELNPMGFQLFCDFMNPFLCHTAAFLRGPPPNSSNPGASPFRGKPVGGPSVSTPPPDIPCHIDTRLYPPPPVRGQRPADFPSRAPTGSAMTWVGGFRNRRTSAPATCGDSLERILGLLATSIKFASLELKPSLLPTSPPLQSGMTPS